MDTQNTWNRSGNDCWGQAKTSYNFGCTCLLLSMVSLVSLGHQNRAELQENCGISKMLRLIFYQSVCPGRYMLKPKFGGNSTLHGRLAEKKDLVLGFRLCS